MPHHQAKEQPYLYPGEDVWIPDQGTEGNILKEDSQRSCSVFTPGEGIIRRNRRHLNSLPPQPEKQREPQRSEPADDARSMDTEEKWLQRNCTKSVCSVKKKTDHFGSLM